MLLNNILIVIFLIAIGCGVFFYFRYLSRVEVEEEYVNPYTINYLTKVVSDTFSDILRQNLREMNLSRKELEQKNNTKSEIRLALKEAAYGNKSARSLILQYIRDIIRGTKGNISAETIDNVIPFGRKEMLKSRDKVEICIYLYERKYKKRGFAQMIDDYSLNAPKKRKDGNIYYEISSTDIDTVYTDLIAKEVLSYQDKLNIVAQRIFAQYKGFGAADILFRTTVDEIDGGVSGIPENNFEISVDNPDDIEYSYDSIWIMYKGINIKMSCLSFGSQSELKRVCQNIYKFNPPAALSKRNGRIVSTMADGSRIVVVRPEVSDSWVFFARKFDSTPSIAPDKLFSDENSIVPITVMKWLIRGYLNIGITGAQGTGKSTTLKSLIRFIPESLSLRIQELAFELNLRYTYPKRGIVSFQETASVSSQEELDLQKKTNGSVNIIGEIATSSAASWLIQTSMVASLFSLFTHHAKTTWDLIISIRNSLLEHGGFSDEKAAEEMVAKVLNFDIHMEKLRGHRFCERISEIIPIKDRRYPSEVAAVAGNCMSLQDQLSVDTIEYQRRMTDRQLFDVKNIVEWHNGKYYMVNMLSDDIIHQIRNRLSPEEESQFLDDMKMLKNIMQTQGKWKEEAA